MEVKWSVSREVKQNHPKGPPRHKRRYPSIIYSSPARIDYVCANASNVIDRQWPPTGLASLPVTRPVPRLGLEWAPWRPLRHAAGTYLGIEGSLPWILTAGLFAGLTAFRVGSTA